MKKILTLKDQTIDLYNQLLEGKAQLPSLPWQYVPTNPREQ